MEEEVKREHPIAPSIIEEAVVKFTKARVGRIAVRRVRVGEKIQAIRIAEGYGETVSVSSSTELLVDNTEAEKKADGGKAAGEGEKTGKKTAQKKAEEESKKNQNASEQLDQQIEESRKQLEQMILDGEVLITNVKVAAEYREKLRQRKQEESHKDRLARLRREAEESQSMYDALSTNWAMKAEKALPMELYKQMKSQQEACDELMTKKDELITFLKREIDDNDFDYEGSLEKYQKDTMLMGDRIDDLVDELRMAFIEELNLIEDYTTKNREVLLEDNQSEWMDLLQHFEAMEQKNLEDRKSDALAKFQILNDHFIATKQEARILRHKMEDDLRILFQEREQVKYSCHLNLEKVAYNLHVLKCRSKENVELKNRMKRILIQLHDKFDSRAASLRKKMDMGRKHTEKVTKEIQRLESQVITFGQKTLHLALMDHKRFMDLWESNEDLILGKVKGLLDSDKFIYETQLGVEYAIPDVTPAFEARPKEVNKSLGRTYYSAKQSLKTKGSKILPKESVASDDEGSEENSSLVEKETIKADNLKGTCNAVVSSPSQEIIHLPDTDPAIQRRLMIGITNLLCDQNGFIVDEEVYKILDPLQKTGNNLVNLDDALQALGLTDAEEMQGLTRYMLKYVKAMKGLVSTIGEASAGMAEMNVSMTGVIGKAALIDTGSDIDDMDDTELTDSDSNGCIQHPEKYCDCVTEKVKAKEEAERKKKAKDRRNGKKVSRAEKEEEQSQLRMKSRTSSVSLIVEYVPCEVVCCSPPSGGTTEQIIDAFDSDNELEEMLEDVEDEEEEETIIGKPSQPEELADCSLNTSKATVLSWLESVDREKMIENLNVFNEDMSRKCDTMFEEYEREAAEAVEQQEKVIQRKSKGADTSYEEGDDEWEEEGDEQYEDEEEEWEEDEGEEIDVLENEEDKILMCPTEPRPRRLTTDEKRDQEKAGLITLGIIPSLPLTESEIPSQDESKTMSIHSFDSFTDESDDCLYIAPVDVNSALKSFIEDYKNQQKVPTPQEIISKKLARIKYPMYMKVGEYWQGIMVLLNPKGKELWDTVQHCFDEYNKILKKRNENVIEIQRYYQQNYELGHLLQKYFQNSRFSRRSQAGQWDPMGMNYC